MNELCKKISKEAAEIKPQLVEWRRDFHRHPERSFEEHRTAGIVADALEKMNIKVERGVGGTGVVGFLKGKLAGPTIALRADMDAIAVTELSDKEYVSVNKGVMHGCGHDGHTASLLGAAMLLSRLSDELKCNVKFIFQPAEEAVPGGAAPMIKAGCLDGVEAIFGGHFNSPLTVGQAKCHEGLSLASITLFEIEINGKGVHCSYPHLGIDTIMVAAHLLINLQTFVSRQTDPLLPKALSVCQIHGGEHFAATPQTVLLRGAFLVITDEQRSFLEEEIERKAKSTCEMFGAQYKISYQHGSPALVNNKNMAGYARSIISDLLGPDSLKEIPPTLGWEDFAEYLHKIPGAFYFIGACNPEKEIIYPHHHPKFDLDEDALVIMTSIHSLIALNYPGSQ